MAFWTPRLEGGKPCNQKPRCGRENCKTGLGLTERLCSGEQRILFTGATSVTFAFGT